MPRNMRLTIGALALALALPTLGYAQKQSVRPGINDSFRDPNVDEFIGRFEVESREVFARRKEIVAACGIEPGQTVADIGAGTGLFTRLFSDAVGKDGKVIAVDISQKFLDRIQKTCRETGRQNVETVLCKDDSTELPPGSVDVAFICDAYHHFEFPYKTLATLHRALKPGGRFILVEFHRIPGKTLEFLLNHVRAGQEAFEAEVARSGFRKTREERELLSENYFDIFEKAAALKFPIIAEYGGVVPLKAAAEPPRAGTKVVFDGTAAATPGEVNKGLERVARLLNLYGSAGLKADDVKIAIVLHGEATKSVLTDAAYKSRFEIERNPNLPLIRELRKAGVEVFVCGQALNYKGFAEAEVADEIPVAAAALTVLINKQADGYGYLPAH
ncbi:MAG TPA: methyltransferase domain-containing protein [Pirellulales bacterium]|nr:methyltransferase domain-containing protein [Pirellulales bacterium]